MAGPASQTSDARLKPAASTQSRDVRLDTGSDCERNAGSGTHAHRSRHLAAGRRPRSGLPCPDPAGRGGRTGGCEPPARRWCECRCQQRRQRQANRAPDRGFPRPAAGRIQRHRPEPSVLLTLGKALFWDLQAGGHGHQACASCHFHAGADTRTVNQLDPGLNVQPTADNSFGDAFGPTGSGARPARTTPSRRPTTRSTGWRMRATRIRPYSSTPTTSRPRRARSAPSWCRRSRTTPPARP